MNNKLLILGSSSFIGRYLSKKLDYNFEIFNHNSSLCNFLKKFEVKKFSKKFINYNYVIITFSIRPEKINNLKTFQDNVKLIENFVEYFKNYKKLKVIFFSTIEVYQNSGYQINEKTKIRENNLYAKSKIISEEILKNNFNKKSLTIFRLPGVYGYEDRYNSTIGKLIRSAKKNQVIKIDNPELKRDYIFISDVYKITYFFLNNNKSGIFNIVKGKSEKLENIAKNIQKLTNCKIIFDNVDNNKGYNKKNNLIFNNSKLKKTMKKIIFTSTKKGILKYLDKI